VSFLSSSIDAVVAFLLQHVLRYRKDVIKTNLIGAQDFVQTAELEEAISNNYRFLAKIFRQILLRPVQEIIAKKAAPPPLSSAGSMVKDGKSVLVTLWSCR
jgi:hypothetical protein